MADKNPIQEAYAVRVHRAQEEVGKALAQPAGPNRIARITAAQDALIEAETEYQDCLDGTGDPRAPLKR